MTDYKEKWYFSNIFTILSISGFIFAYIGSLAEKLGVIDIVLAWLFILVIVGTAATLAFSSKMKEDKTIIVEKKA
jgi:hypothetical protein